MQRRLSLFAALTALLLATAITPTLAQSRNTGAIRGAVTDETGGRIPGVLVELQSPDLIGGRRAQPTDASGNYRFPELPPGTYVLTFSIEGYQTVRREGIIVQASKSFDVDMSLTPRAGEETITVTSAPPLVDVTSSATTTNFDEAYLQNIPTSSFQPDTLNLAPGIENDSAFGGGGSAANSYQIDGVDVSDPEGGTPWSFFNYDLIKEVQLIGLGAPAEYGGFTGVLFNSVTKSGSNDFEGMAKGYILPSGWVGKNTDDPGLQPPSIERSFDTSLQLGGPIIKDKLWYFVSAQYLKDEQSNGGPIRTETDPRLFAKLTWQINPDNQFTFWGEWDRYDITGRGGDAFTPIESTVTEDAPEWVWNFSWSRILSPNTSLSVSYEGYTGWFYLDPASGYNTRGVYNSDGYVLENSPYFYLADRYRHGVVASISHHSDDFIKGSHDFKYGAELERSRVRSRAGSPGDAYYYDYFYDYYDPYAYTTTRYTYRYAYVGYYQYDQVAINHRVSAFVQDSWKVNDRLTINPGVRLDINRGSIPGTGNVFKTQPIAPRIGFAYDLTGKKRTVLKGHYGRYYEGLKGNYYQQLGPRASSAQSAYLVDPMVPFDPFNVDPAHTLVGSRPERILQVDGDLKQPYMDQFIIGIDHDLGNDFALSGTLIWRENKDFIESVSAPGSFEPVMGIDSDTRALVPLFNEVDPSATTYLLTNPDELERKYTGLMLTATKRFSKRWQMLASYVRSHATGNIDNIAFSFSSLLGSNYGPTPFLDSPNSLYNGQGNLTNDLRHELTLQGQYIIPKVEVTVSADYRYVSGQHYTPIGTSREYVTMGCDPNTVGDCASYNQGRVRYFAEGRGSRKLDALDVLIFRAEKYFSFNGGTRLGVFADAFNALNKGEDISVNTLTGPTFGNSTTFSLPRYWRLGVRYNW